MLPEFCCQILFRSAAFALLILATTGAAHASCIGGVGNPTLTVESSGALSVSITSSDSQFIGVTTYSQQIKSGCGITLSAPVLDPPGYTFSHWSGCQSTSGTPAKTCGLASVTATLTVTANYATATAFALDVASVGAANVVITSSPAGYGGTTGTTDFPKNVAANTVFSLIAPTSAGGAAFVGWTGCTSTSGTTCSLTMNANKSVTATYAAPGYTLNVSSSGAANVAITSSPAGYGGTTGTADFPKTNISAGTAITLTAPVTAGGANFVDWTGCTSSSGTTCSLTMNASKSVIANYTPPAATYSLNVTSAGAASVVITSATGHGGTTNYERSGLASGISVQLTAPASAAGATFLSWTGCTSVSGRTCTRSMDTDRTVQVNYQTSAPTFELSVTSIGASNILIDSDTGHGGWTNYTLGGLLSGTSVRLSAPVDGPGGVKFVAWQGCDGNPTPEACELSIANVNRIVTVRYASVYALTVAASGATSVTIASSPGGYGGVTSYSKANIVDGATLQLTAPANAPNGAPFLNWTGCNSTSARSCTVTITGNRTVTVNYTTYSLSVTSTGASNVSITSVSGHGGTTTYARSGISRGTTVKLWAPATFGALAFGSWSGCDSANRVECTLAMTGNRAVNVSYFVPDIYTNTVCTGYIGIPDSGRASPYPVTINANLPESSTVDLWMEVGNLVHTYVSDIAIVLVAPDGTAMTVQQAFPGLDSRPGISYAIDWMSPSVMPQSPYQVIGGSYRPTVLYPAYLDPPAPDLANISMAAPYGSAQMNQVFAGKRANGEWRIFVFDAAGGDQGYIGNVCLHLKSAESVVVGEPIFCENFEEDLTYCQ